MALALKKEWITDIEGFVAPTVASAGGLVFEEITNAAVRSALGLAGTRDFVYRNFHRVLFSGLYWFLGKRLGRPKFGLLASSVPLALVFVDLLATALRQTPEEVGRAVGLRLKALGARAWRAGASASYSVPAKREAKQETKQEAGKTEGGFRVL